MSARALGDRTGLSQSRIALIEKGESENLPQYFPIREGC
ncbi:hypothetical protein [Winslowiella toletana]|nr:hypothetical protein [Winslowiella toletana]